MFVLIIFVAFLVRKYVILLLW